MGEFTDKEKLHHYMGIEMNIQTWNLLGKENWDVEATLQLFEKLQNILISRSFQKQ